MTFRKWILLSSALCVGAMNLSAQETNDVEQLKRQLQQMQENFDRVQREQKQQIDDLARKVEQLTAQKGSEAEKKQLEQKLAAEMAAPPPAVSPAAGASAGGGASWSAAG